MYSLIGLLQKTIASPGRGILAMDESNATCGKRLASIGLENTEANRQAYRTLLVTAPGLGNYISGAILFEETLYQSTTDGRKMVDVLTSQNIVPGIKVDKVSQTINQTVGPPIKCTLYVSKSKHSSTESRALYPLLVQTMNPGAKVSTGSLLALQLTTSKALASPNGTNVLCDLLHVAR